MMRWFTIIASQQVFSESMRFDAEVRVEVLARDWQDAMRRVRPEFRHWHLRVL